MKKVLLGLVIAVMMTGSGHSRLLDQDLCRYLLINADNHIRLAKYWDETENDEFNMEGQSMIEAERFANTFTAFCD
tara:strand:- start:218 stop:445 length:228 start_codon:yes stop_codon:yes gene_type:complete